MTSPARFFRQIVAPNGRHRPHRRPSPARGVFVQSWEDCRPCGKATAGVLHKDGWTCGECLKTALPEAEAGNA